MKSEPAKLNPETIDHEIRNLIGASRRRLKQTWRSLYGTKAPERMSEDHLKRAIAYRLQERVFGGLSSATRRLLERVTGDDSTQRPGRGRSKTRVRPGTLLVREWHGKTHQVTVVENGVVYRDRSYRSLSEVAHLITGVPWSGPLFFGLKGTRKELQSGTR